MSRKKYYQKPNLVSAVVIPVIVGLLLSGLLWYLLIPCMNVRSIELWVWLFISLAILTACYFFGSRNSKENQGFDTCYVIGIIVTLGVLILTIILSLTGWKLFHASRYASIITVADGVEEDIPDADIATDAIALMDTDSARMLGDREIGSLSKLVSQYDVSSRYTQIAYQNQPKKVSALIYSGFFKWMNRRAEGVPGYVIVDPVAMNAEYVETDGMKYVPSAYFSEDLMRYLRIKYPTVMMDTAHFEIDENGKGYYVAPTFKKTIGAFGGKVITGVLVVDPVNGDVAQYEVGEIPDWVDVIYQGEYICDMYNNYGMLQNGFFNSIFAQNGCRQVTSGSSSDDEDDVSTDFGYFIQDNDVWIYTGITSANGDSSNLGFILANERTMETKYITCSGADEFSAMAAAEGEVQEKGYNASFPSLLTVDGEPTYLMVLKDSNGLVKLYACVNAEQYNTVVTGKTVEAALRSYREAMGLEVSDSSDVVDEPETDVEKVFEEKTIEVAYKELIVVDGNTYVYISDVEGNVYHAKAVDVIQLALLPLEQGSHLVINVWEDEFTYSNAVAE